MASLTYEGYKKACKSLEVLLELRSEVEAMESDSLTQGVHSNVHALLSRQANKLSDALIELARDAEAVGIGGMYEVSKLYEVVGRWLAAVPSNTEAGVTPLTNVGFHVKHILDAIDDKANEALSKQDAPVADND